MSPKTLIALVPAIVVLIAAASCGFSAQVHDAEYGEFGNIAIGLTTLAAIVLALVVGVLTLIADRVSKGSERTVAASLLLAAVMMPIGVAAGVQLGENGVIAPAPTLPPELRPTPLPTLSPPGGGAPDAQPTGTMTLDLDAPSELHVSGAASCDNGHSYIHDWDQNADWDIDWSGRVVITGVQLYIVARPPGPTSVDRLAITFTERRGNKATYSSSLPEWASNVEDGGQSGEVDFELGQTDPDWPATLTGRIGWRCDF
jgi:hypothetical protein